MSRAVPVGTGGNADTGDGLLLHRVGPAGSLPSDGQFGIALTSLWHAVSEGGGAVGFVPGVQRPEVARRVAAVVDELRRGTVEGFAVTDDRTLVGFVALRPGSGVTAHTGEIERLMVDPGRQRGGLGGVLLRAVLDRAAALGLQRLSLSVRDGHGLVDFYRRFGFLEWGRRPAWVRVAEAVGTSGPDDRDEIFLSIAL